MRKFLLSIFAFSVLSVHPAVSFSNETIFDFRAIEPELNSLVLNQPSNLIDWKVGDSMSYQLTLGIFGNVGTSEKAVTADEGHAIWMRQTMKVMNQNEVVDALINKADGKLLKLIRNGQEQQIPEDSLEIISQDYTTVTVPAGKFEVLHIVAKSKDISKIEIWANPPATCMDGAVQQAVATQFGDLVMKLTQFNKVQ